jgi:wyosine [tRNA(Phe)-imidazoG37] synthetase (radical SAM superfamily)
MGELIETIQSMTEIPVAVLTNGSLLSRPEVRSDLMHADVVLPSLDAGNATLFRAVNRPHPAITFERLIDGLASFRKEFKGEYWLEVLLLAGHTGMVAEIKQIAKIAARIGADRVHLNTCVRPPAEEFAYAVGWKRLVELADLFTPPAEVIADLEPGSSQSTSIADCREILEVLQRRPCTVPDIAAGLGVHPGEVVKEIEGLVEKGLVKARRLGDKQMCYVAVMADFNNR